MPQDRSADVEAVISHIDAVFTSGPQSEIDKIKANFGLSNLKRLRRDTQPSSPASLSQPTTRSVTAVADTIISCLILLQRTCPYFFPEAFPLGSSPSPNVANTTSAYKAWNVRVDRLFFANGIREYSSNP